MSESEAGRTLLDEEMELHSGENKLALWRGVHSLELDGALGRGGRLGFLFLLHFINF